MSEEHRCQICFALATVYENLGDFAAAFEYYSEGNALRRKHLGHDRALVTESFEKLKFNYANLAAKRLEETDITPAKFPIFIVGMPRSGTTLVEQIISSHSLVAAGGELPFVAEHGGELASGISTVNIAAMKHQGAVLVPRSLNGGTIFISPTRCCKTFVFGTDRFSFPEAKIIHVKRRTAAMFGQITRCILPRRA